MVKMKRQLTGIQNGDLPPEIMHEILSRLPVKPLCRFKCVSKPWRSLISHPDFVAKYSKVIENKDVFFQRRRLLFTFVRQEHHWLYSLDLDQFLNENHNVDVGGLVATPAELDFVYKPLPRGGRDWIPFVHYSSYGLFLSRICCGDFSFSLINPVTKESKKLPKTPIWRLPMKPLFRGVSLNGLGFDYSTNVYKVVNGQHYDDGTVFSVYSLQTDSWRQIDYLFPYKALDFDGIVVNGAVHWLVRKVADRSLVIISFLLAEEEVREIPLPPIPGTCSSQLGVFRNWLCITLALPRAEIARTNNEFWVMKEYGVTESWTKMQVSKPYKELSHSSFWTESHDLMLFDKSLVMYNFNDGTFWNLSISDLSENGHFGSIGIYVESLPSLTDQEQHKRSKEDKSTQ
ncbi:F-box/kelch-repeat protein At3g06240-like isoform X1 [Rosa rugosa]|uniref:F-box/kelch-repeat protein At3g06240-like isoform X1 n=1 Tax=Rosa rugosa TaxID=74645 RepID=UPI002B415D36|nr:F-box/kelch-repeat protein At3g06240-like isoform X1 [Rosa rugosa]